MLFDFIKETLSLYDNEAEYFPVRVTYINDPLDADPGKSDFYATGHRVDTPRQETITIYVPSKNFVLNVGDYILVKHLGNGFSVYISHLYTKQLTKINAGNKEEAISHEELSLARPILPQLTYRYSVGEVYNNSVVYLSAIDSYRAKEPNFKYKFFVEFPSLVLYKRFYDVFDYDNKFADIVDDKNEDLESRKKIFYFSHNPKEKDFLINLNKDNLFPFRPDPVFDSLHSKSATNEKKLLLEEENKFDLTAIDEYKTDKYPLLDFRQKIGDDKFLFTAYDEIINKDTPYESLKLKEDIFDIFYAQEFYEVKIGRNKFGLYKISKEDTFVTLKSAYDQQFSALKQKDLGQVRIRNLDGSSILLESNSSYKRSFIGTNPSLIFEQFYKDQYQHILLLNAEKNNFYSLQTSGGSLSDYSFLLLLKGNKDSSLNRTNFDYFSLNSSQTIAYGAKQNGNIGYASLSVGSNSIFKLRLESTRKIELTLDANTNELIFMNSLSGQPNTMYFKDKQFMLTNNDRDIDIHIDGMVYIDKNLIVNSNTNLNDTLTVQGISTFNGPATFNSLVTMGSGFSASGAATVNGKQLACFSGSNVVPC
jgi:hypothetical protein